MNFEFIKDFKDFSQLYKDCSSVEALVLNNPRASVSLARICNEYIIKFIYSAKVGDISTYTAYDLLIKDSFKAAVDNDETLLSIMHYIRKMGNIALHDSNPLTEEDSLYVLEDLHFLVGEFFISLGLIEDYPIFVKPTKDTPTNDSISVSLVEPEEIELEKDTLTRYGEDMKFVKFAYKGEDMENNAKRFIEACLRESGWPITKKDNTILPFSVTLNYLLPNKDKVDHVVNGNDGKPLAIIEYTVSSQNLFEGKLKAIEQAEAFEKIYGYKPIVYYTDGFNIFCIDWLGFNTRRVFTFHTINELELLTYRRSIKTPIDINKINTSIVDRDYQIASVKAICDAFTSGRRRSLVVLATGTGKTRVSIAAVDLLLANNWVKNILFLADRTSLVHQAQRAFTKLMPSITTSVFTGDSLDKDLKARIIFSTYQSMLPLIDNGNKTFSVGRFDLIIIDEAHRSIFDKYGAIFSYFDSLIIGLTATPKNNYSHSTYEFLQIPNDTPDYEYGLEQAVSDKYLVGFSIVSKVLKWSTKRKFKYSDLTEEQKELNESLFDFDDKDLANDEKTKARRMDGRNVNIPSIDTMLNDLMSDGLKVEAGDKIGKTIIFAKTHFEAEAIVDRFNHFYGETLGDDFCKLIDSTVDDTLTLIDRFSTRDSLPQIAVTVTLLDTGIDVPDILNLVFFKQIHSKIKFLQMIGRGTRLSKDIYGPGIDKNGFFIFDYYENFAYFQKEGNWMTTVQDEKKGKSCFSKNYYETLFNLVHVLIRTSPCESINMALANELTEKLFKQMSYLVNDSVQVQSNMQYVIKYRNKGNWMLSNKECLQELISKISPLFPSCSDPQKVKMIDHAFYNIERAISHKRLGEPVKTAGVSTVFIQNTLNKICSSLLKQTNIPAIGNKEDLLRELEDLEKYTDFTIEQCETYRKALRELIQFVDFPNHYYKFILQENVKDKDIEDEVFGDNKGKNQEITNFKNYLQTPNPILDKIKSLQPLNKIEYDTLVNELQNIFLTTGLSQITKNNKILPYLRMQLGIDDSAINLAFGHFLNQQILTADQLDFCNQIIKYAKDSGDFIPVYLQTVSPFCDVDIVQLFQGNMQYLIELINGLHNPIKEEDSWIS